jgi:hypothetical protein
VVSVLPIPGFAAAPVAVATLRDGTALLLDLRREGCPRVAGTFRGPIGAIDVAGEWAVAAAGSRASVYRLRRTSAERSTDGKCSCTPHNAKESSWQE